MKHGKQRLRNAIPGASCLWWPAIPGFHFHILIVAWNCSGGRSIATKEVLGRFGSVRFGSDRFGFVQFAKIPLYLKARTSLAGPALHCEIGGLADPYSARQLFVRDIESSHGVI